MLPAPILSNPSSSMQKKLQMVKRERFDNDSVVATPISGAGQQEETLMETTSASAETPATSESTSSSVEIDNILKKYNLASRLSK